MMLIEKVTQQIPGQSGRTLAMTHQVADRGDSHVLRFYEPHPENGPLAGTLVFQLTLTREQAAELKAHL